MQNILLKVPHIHQNHHSSCGVSALLMQYQYLDVNKKGETQTTLWNKLKEPALIDKGEYTPIMNSVKDAENRGLMVIIGRVFLNHQDSALQPIEEFLKNGIAVEVQQQSKVDKKFGHAKLVIGITQEDIIVNDPFYKKGARKINKEKFLKIWQKTSQEMTGGVLMAIFKKEQGEKIKKLLLKNVYTNFSHQILFTQSQKHPPTNEKGTSFL